MPGLPGAEANHGGDWLITKASTQDATDAIAEFRYRVYVERDGIFADVADHQNRRLSDVHDPTGTLYAAVCKGTVIGTIRINGFADNVPTFCLTHLDILAYHPDVLTRGAFVSRAIVDPEWRKSALFGSLVLHMMRDAVSQGVRYVFIEVARMEPTEDAYLALYKAMGFRIWRREVDVPRSGLSAIMAINVDEELQRPGSMAAAYLRSHAGA